MNVLILIKNSGIGGVLSCSVSLARALSENGDEVTIAIPKGAGIDFYSNEIDIDVEIIPFDSKKPITIISNYTALKKIIAQKKIQIILCQNRIPALYAAFYCFFHKKTKYIWSNHRVPLPSSFMWRLLTRYGYSAVAEGIDGKEMLVNSFHIPPDRVEVINLGTNFHKTEEIPEIQLEELKKELEIKDDKVILLLGRLVEDKGHLVLIEAIKKYKNEKFVLIFPGENDEFKDRIIEKAKEYEIDDKIRFPGFIDSKKYLSISDLMVLPSFYEGFGIVNVEAFCEGVPVIRTKTSGYRDMQDCCFGIDVGDANGLEELLGSFFDGDTKFIEKAEYALTQVYRFTEEEMVRKYRNLFQNAIDGK